MRLTSPPIWRRPYSTDVPEATLHFIVDSLSYKDICSALACLALLKNQMNRLNFWWSVCLVLYHVKKIVSPKRSSRGIFLRLLLFHLWFSDSAIFYTNCLMHPAAIRRVLPFPLSGLHGAQRQVLLWFPAAWQWHCIPSAGPYFLH